MTGIAILTVAIWVACIGWVTLDAQRRAISPIFWPLVTLLSGPFGLVAYGMVRELVEKRR